MFNRDGPSTDPCGTPAFTLCICDISDPILTWKLRFVMNDKSVLFRYIGRFRIFIFEISP